MTPAPCRSPHPRPDSRGIAAAVVTNLIWGAFPIYFSLLLPAGAGEIVAARIVLSFAMLVLLATIARRWRRIAEAARSPRTLLLLAGAGAVVALNWLLYVTAIEVGRVLEASLAYFITPIISALLGSVLLRERASRLFWVSVGIAGGGVLVLIAGYGQTPWIGLAMSVTFAIYGLLKRLVGPRVAPVDGLVLETGAVAPFAIAFGFHLAASGQLITGSAGSAHALLMLGLAVVSLAPFITFGIAAARLQLTRLGFIGYITPMLVFVAGLTYFGEDMPLFRWIGFGVTWIALAVFAVDTWRGTRRR
ncbi:EamA family transporter RarD [Agrococcus carbonis]|uniref:Chloramphenicol-sensitive protein RarD n=1 Tax=Agrococcus carbonis TaxID=684552 RepID=A0A1H1PRH3_9MICO|nr:EamA family transporter RarD [Agrococcus carbonis]SDS13745.1 chloramphenicol-sensitive protein RarD [Agrococcus carbonis]